MHTALLGDVLVVDDEAAAHEVVARYFGARWRLHGAYSVWQAVELLDQGIAVDLALVDLALPGPTWPRSRGGPGAGFFVIAEVARRHPGALRAVFSAYVDHRLVNTAQELGAEYVVKKAFGRNLRLLEARLRERVGAAGARASGSLDDLAAAAHLSSRERQVLGLAGQGLAYDDIAELLEIAPDTVKSHVSSILTKTGADSMKHLLRRAHDQTRGSPGGAA